MTLSPEREAVLTMALEKASEDVTAEYDKKLKHLRKVKVSSTAERKQLLNTLLTLGRYLAEIFREHYEAEQGALREEDLPEIGARVTYYLTNNRYIDPEVWNYPGIWGVSWNEVSKDIARKVERDLHLYVKGKPLERQPHLTTTSVESVRRTDFSFVSNLDLRRIIERDYAELQRLDPVLAPKSVVAVAGSIVEGILLDAIVTSGYWPYEEASGRFLKDMVHPAVQQGIIQHENSGNVVRVFCNLVHPAREIRDKLVFDQAHAELANAALKLIIGEVRSWYKKNQEPAP